MGPPYDFSRWDQSDEVRGVDLPGHPCAGEVAYGGFVDFAGTGSYLTASCSCGREFTRYGPHRDQQLRQALRQHWERTPGAIPARILAGATVAEKKGRENE